MRHAYLSRFIGLLATAVLFFSQNVFSQTVGYMSPDNFDVCDRGLFEITVNNTSNETLTGVTVTVDFNTSSGTECGVAYLEGTVLDATEDDISDLGAPVFSVPDVPTGQLATFTFEAEAPCSVVDCIDGAEIFVNQISLSWDGGNFGLTTDPYDIERALLVITDIDQALMNGSQGDVLLRKITIVNSRPGALQGFLFTDDHQGGIEISANIGTDISPGGNSFQLALDGSDFVTIGDGDELFELNETIEITEEILITDCGVDINSTVSNFTVGWGCGGDICQEVSANAIITLSPSEREPLLIFEPITSTADCFCGPDGYQQGMQITNVGTGPALDFALNIFKQFPPVDYLIDTASIVVDSGGMTLALEPVFNSTDSYSLPCVAPDGMTGNFIVTIPEIGANETVTIFFDVYFCQQECPQPRVDWWYLFSFFKECPPNPFFQITDPVLVFDQGISMSVDLSNAPPGPMQDDSTITMTYDLAYDSLTLLDDTMVLEIVLPCGMNWLPSNELIIDGQMPLSYSTDMGSPFTTITTTYLLPFSSNEVSTTFDFVFNCEDICFEDQFCLDSLVSSCMGIDTCDSPLIQLLGMEVTTTLRKCPEFPNGCNLQNCAAVGLQHECPIDSVCLNAPPGYVSYDFAAARKNYGLADDNDDQLPDGTGGANLALVERHRAMTGDTLRAEIRGEVVVDVPGATLPYGRVDFFFLASHLSATNGQQLLTDETGIQQAGTLIRIFDSSSGQYFDCSAPTAIVTDDARLGYTYDLSAAALGSCVPANFEFAEGDSILVTADFRIEHNITPDLDIDPLLGWLTLEAEVFVFDQDTSVYEPINCGCTSQRFEVSGYDYGIIPGIFGLPPCGPSEYVGGNLFVLDLHESNFFSFEYRNLIELEDWKIELPASIGLVESQLSFWRYQDNTTLFQLVPLTPTGSNPYQFDVSPFQQPPTDEGFRALFRYKYQAECDIVGSLPMTITSNLKFDDGLGEDVNPLEFSETSNSLRAMIPNLSAEAIVCDIISFNDQLVFDFSFANFPTVVASQSSGDAPDTWMYVTSPSGLVTDFQLIDPLTGDEFPQVNGVFQLGSFPIDTIPLQLIATNNSCQTEPLELHYGWHCDPFTSQVQTPCYEQVKALSIFSPPGEIDFTVESPMSCTELCDTVPHHILEIFNGQLGSVYQLTTTAQLPPGLTVIPGSSEVEYPTGSGTWVPIGDPTALSNTLVEWNLSELITGLADGLPGLGFAPQNSLRLRFLSGTDCDIVANGFILFNIAAEQNCGIASNTVSKAGEPICILGLDPAFATQVNVEAGPGFGCNDEVVFELSLTSSEEIPLGACVIVNLPVGVAFEQGSCSSVCQANFNCTPEIDGTTLTWQMPAGVPPNQIVCFEFNTTGWLGLDCTQGFIQIATAAESAALCTLTGDSCSAKVQTGSLLFPYDIQRPEFSLENFNVTASQSGTNDIIDFSILVTNDGAQNEPPITIDFYLDPDGNGIGDQLVHTENVVATLSNGQSEIVTGSFTVPSGNLCNLLAVIDPEVQCACAGDAATVALPIDYQTEQILNICSNDVVSIGVAEMPGFTYQWTPADCLFDEQAATTIFSCANDETQPVTYDFTLSETNGSTCEINNLLNVTVQPVPGIAFSDSPICQGESANIAATDGDSYQWSGPGTVPDVQVQTVNPSTSTSYSVTVTDEFGCSGSESVDIVVNPLPAANAGDDVLVCPGQMAQLNAEEVPGADYLWSPTIVGGAPALDNPTIPNPEVLTNQNTTFTLEVTDSNGCMATDDVTVDFGGTFDLEVPPDVTICLGSSTTLTASGADTYDWSPSGTCLDPPTCSSIEVSPLATTTYLVEGTAIDGCMASGSVVVTVTEDTILVNLDTLQICEGETAVIFGEVVSETGTYCDTIPGMGSDCDTVFCQNLLVNPFIDTTFSAVSICEGESIIFENMEVSEPGLTCVTYPTPSGCDSTLCLDLTVIPLPDITLTILPDTMVEMGQEITLSIEPTVFDSIVWMGDSLLEACTNLPECTDILGDSSVVYTVTVFDENGCAGTALQLVTVGIECDPTMAEIPNVFTPNGDGVNDVWTIVTPDQEEVLSMKIWNRWGEKVYDGPGPWDGFQDGEPAVSDVYIYVVRVGCPVQVEAEEEVLKGDVTLLR